MLTWRHESVRAPVCSTRATGVYHVFILTAPVSQCIFLWTLWGIKEAPPTILYHYITAHNQFQHSLMWPSPTYHHHSGNETFPVHAGWTCATVLSWIKNCWGQHTDRLSLLRSSAQNTVVRLNPHKLKLKLTRGIFTLVPPPRWLFCDTVVSNLYFNHCLMEADTVLS